MTYNFILRKNDMNNERNIYTALAEHLRENQDRRSLVFYRSDMEIEALRGWLSPSGGTLETSSAPSTIDEVTAIIRGCVKCNDVREKKYGYGSGSNGVMIILNAPQMIKQPEKERLKKDSIDMMKRMMKAIGVDFAQCYTTNLYKCESGTMKPSDLYTQCAVIIKQEVEILNPRTVIVMGEIIPLKKIMDAAQHIRWFSIPHPIVLLRNPDMKSAAWNTLQLAKESVHRSDTGGRKG